MRKYARQELTLEKERETPFRLCTPPKASLIQRSGKSIGQMALERRIGETALRRWVAQAEVEAGRVPRGPLTRSEREEPVELRREKQRPRMERAILKTFRMPCGRRHLADEKLRRPAQGAPAIRLATCVEISDRRGR